MRKNTFCNNGASCACGLRISTPAANQELDKLSSVRGTASPCETVTVTIDHYPALQTCTDSCGRFRVANPYALAGGTHKVCVCACSTCCRVCRTFRIRSAAVPPPTIDTPANGSVIADPMPWITGRGIPGNTVRVCLGSYGCRTVIVDPNGEYRVNFDVPLPDGPYTVTATQINPNGQESVTVSSNFTVDTAAFLVEPLEARMGKDFRTVDIDVLVSGASGSATVYYLLLPPGSPAPTASDIMHYPNAAALRNGTAASGQFNTTITQQPTSYTWTLTGLDNPNAPLGTTGVIDGYRYDAYIYVVFAAANSGVLTFGEAAMGMPFSGGIGTANNPFTIKELSASALQNYPDLLAGNALNEPGVDENARMLENIERLVTLYEKTDGLYGLENSMSLHYLMTSDLDLANYASAYNGAGWQSIGDIDGWINDDKENEHLFSGVFDGGNYSVTNLSITPNAANGYFVGYRGLFGGVDHGTLKNLVLSNVTINAFATPPGHAQFGSFIAICYNPVLENLTLLGANILADIGPVSIGDTHAVYAGGFVGEMFDGGTVSNITGQNITITVPDRSALALGGFAGYSNSSGGYESYDNVQLSSVTLSGHALIGGLIGYVVYSVNHINNVLVNQITVTAPGGESGGLIGRLYLYDNAEDCLIENCSVQKVSVFIGSGNNGGEIGGLIGRVGENVQISRASASSDVSTQETKTRAAALAASTLTVRRCNVSGGQLNCGNDGGGLIGRISISAPTAQHALVTLCRADIPLTVLADNAGGLIGLSENTAVAQSFASGNVSCTGSNAGALIGCAYQNTVSDCYATGNVNGHTAVAGLIGYLYATAVSFNYATGNATALPYNAATAGGIGGAAEGTIFSDNLVLGGTISGAMAHRILGSHISNVTLSDNYARDTVIPSPPADDPNGVDGGTITAAEIVSTMQSLGWDTTAIWNTDTVTTLNRPTLLQNPE